MTMEIDSARDRDLIEEKISSETIFDGTLLHVRRDQVKLPNGNVSVREWIHHPGASAVIPLVDNGDILLVRQYLYPMGVITLEIPAGKLDAEGEDPLACAQRELSEETGYRAEHYEKLISLATTVGFSNEIIHIYAAYGLQAGAQHTDEDEFIHVYRVPLDEAVQLVEQGQIVDAKTITAILLLHERRRRGKD